MTAQSGLHTRPPSVAVAKDTLAAIVQDAYGAAPEDVLRLEEIERPTIGEREALRRVRAASVDRGTWQLTAGLPYLIRLAGFGVRRPSTPIPGTLWPERSKPSAATWPASSPTMRCSASATARSPSTGV